MPRLKVVSGIWSYSPAMAMGFTFQSAWPWSSKVAARILWARSRSSRMCQYELMSPLVRLPSTPYDGWQYGRWTAAISVVGGVNAIAPSR